MITKRDVIIIILGIAIAEIARRWIFIKFPTKGEVVKKGGKTGNTLLDFSDLDAMSLDEVQVNAP